MDTLLLEFYQAHRLSSLAALASLSLLLIAWLRRDRRLDTMPGPRGYPLIGSIGYQLPPRAPAAFRRWAREYGDVFRVRVGWYDWVVLNTPEAVREVLEKQAAHTSSKAPSPLGHDVVTGGNRMPTMPYGARWKALRAIVREITTVPMTNSFAPSQEFETKQLLFDLAGGEDGANNANTTNTVTDERAFYQHMRRFAFSIIMTTCFGTRVQSWEHEDARNAVRSQAVLRRTSRPGAFLVDELPPLARLPTWLQPGRRAAERAAAEVLEIKMDLWRRLARSVDDGTAPHSFAREVYEKREAWYKRGDGLTDEHLAWVTGGLVEAGFETTAATLNSLVLHLAAQPRVQAKAHAELMRAVGPARLPGFDDLTRLPYVRACVKEMLRLNPILTPGIRHYADADVSYKGHVIPRGTVLLANTAFLHRDPARFERADDFWPERYERHELHSADYAAMPDPYRRDHFTFSTGRRTCPGARLAENSLGIALAGILWAFEIRPPLVAAASAAAAAAAAAAARHGDGGDAKGRNGKEEQEPALLVEAEMDLSDDMFLDEGFTIPKPFAARFLARDDARLRLLRRSWETARREGYKLRGRTVSVEGVTDKC